MNLEFAPAWKQLALLSRDIPKDPRADNIAYISGPMSGVKDYNYPAFMAKAAQLRSLGYTVINPAELHEPGMAVPWDWYLRRDIAQLVKCNRLILLPGWQTSRGARLERRIAEDLGMSIIYPQEDA